MLACRGKCGLRNCPVLEKPSCDILSCNGSKVSSSIFMQRMPARCQKQTRLSGEKGVEQHQTPWRCGLCGFQELSPYSSCWFLFCGAASVDSRQCVSLGFWKRDEKKASILSFNANYQSTSFIFGEVSLKKLSFIFLLVVQLVKKTPKLWVHQTQLWHRFNADVFVWGRCQHWNPSLTKSVILDLGTAVGQTNPPQGPTTHLLWSFWLYHTLSSAAGDVSSAVVELETFKLDIVLIIVSVLPAAFVKVNHDPFIATVQLFSQHGGKVLKVLRVMLRQREDVLSLDFLLDSPHIHALQISSDVSVWLINWNNLTILSFAFNYIRLG